MQPRIKELLDHLDATRLHLRSSVDGVAPEDRQRQPGGRADRWSVAGVLEHLVILETSITKVISRKVAEARAAGIAAETETTSVIDPNHLRTILDRSRTVSAPERAHPRLNLDVESAWRALESSREAFRAVILDADGLALGTITHPHPLFGELTIYQWIAFMGGHEARHAAQIREIGEQLPGPSS